MNYALIKDGLVKNVIVATPEFSAQISHEWDHIEPVTGNESIGWSWDAANGFVSPVVPDVPVEPVKRLIFVGSFFDRFGAAKWAILSDANASVQALVKDCQVRRYIDLDSPELLSGLQMLVQAGHAIDPQAIVGAEVTEDERWTR